MKNKKYTKLVQLFMGLLIVALTLFSGVGQVFAAEPGDTAKLNITLNKLLFDKTEKPLQNDGEVKPGYTEAGTPLQGATFEIFDVTTAYYTALGAGTTEDEKKAARDAVASPTGAGQSVTTDAAGKALFANLDLKDGSGKDKVYVFKETTKLGAIVRNGVVQADSVIAVKGDKRVTALAQNMVVVLPMFHVTGDTTKLNRDIQLYPKNVQDGLEISKARDGYSHNYGEAIDFRITGKLPTAYKEFVDGATSGDSVVKSFTFTDTYDTSLEYVASSTIAGLDPADYTVDTTSTPNQFTVTIKQSGINKLAATNTQTFVFKYQMKIVKDSAVDTEFKNNVTEAESVVQYNSIGDSTTLTDEGNTVIVATGGYQFKKVDADDNTKLLAGAEFEVQDASNNVLYEDANGYKFLADADDKTGYTKVVKTSGADGTFEINGLKDGKYSLVETKTPAGYVTPSKNHEFTIVTGKQHKTDETAAKVTEGSLVDAQGNAILSTGVVVAEAIKGSFATGVDALAYLVKNTKKVGFLPSTGGNGILMFIIVGIIMIVLGGLYFGRKLKKA